VEPFDATTRRLVHEERRLALTASARGDRSRLEQRLGLLLIAAGTRLAADQPRPRHAPDARPA
jgi:hypothetical protein